MQVITKHMALSQSSVHNKQHIVWLNYFVVRVQYSSNQCNYDKCKVISLHTTIVMFIVHTVHTVSKVHILYHYIHAMREKAY